MAVNGSSVSDVRGAMIEIALSNKRAPVLLTVERERRSETLTLDRATISSMNGLAGIGLENTGNRAPPTLSEAFTMSSWRVVDEFRMTYRILVGLFTGNVSTSSLAGPVGVVHAMTSSAAQGFVVLLGSMVSISFALAIFNLLPVPITDGGHLLRMAIESIFRFRFSERAQLAYVLVGAAVLLFVMVTTLFSDVLRLFA